MRKRSAPFLAFAAALAIGLAGERSGSGEDGQEQRLMPIPEEVPAAVDAAPQLPQPVVVPQRPLPGYLGYSVSAAVPLRMYRRGPLAGYAGVYVAPRYVSVYAGHLAPWGSVPAGFYAAGVPLPLRMAQPSGYLGPAAQPEVAGHEARPFARPESFVPFTPQLPPQRFTTSVAKPQTAEAETIPTPSPMDSRTGGLINRPVIEPQAKKQPITSGSPTFSQDSYGAPGSGAREF